MIDSSYDSIAVVGPTAAGKTRRAVEIAATFDGEIISADSRQLYRGMTIGTGKDLNEYGDIPYHLVDIADAGERLNLHRYLILYHEALEKIMQRGKLPVVCGGSGMYVENALSGVVLPEVPENPILRQSLQHLSLQELTKMLAGIKKLHNTTDVDTVKRAIRAIEIEQYYTDHPEEAKLADRKAAKPQKALIIGIDIDRETRRERITRRLVNRLEEGMIDEIRTLLDSGIAPDDLIYYGLEYKYITLHVIGRLSREEMFTQLETAIHQFAKRQMTWFRGMEKRGFKINWLPYDLTADDFISEVQKLYSALQGHASGVPAMPGM